MTETIASSEITRDRPEVLLVLWRHEESTMNRGDKLYVQGFSPAAPLSEDGKARAEQSGAPGLRAFLDQNNLEIVAAVMSEANRAQDTAAAVLGGAGVSVSVTVDKRLNEHQKGDVARGGVEGMERRLVETAAYKAREKAEGWEFRPGADNKPGVAESGAQTPGEVGAGWLDWRNELTAAIENGALPPTQDPSKIPVVIAFGHNMRTAYGMGYERDMTVPESKELYRVGNGQALVLGWDGQAWNLEGELYRPADANA